MRTSKSYLIRVCYSKGVRHWCFQWTTVERFQFSSVQLLSLVRLCDPMNTRPPYSSPTSGDYPNSCPLSWWCHPTISSYVVPFSSCPQSFPASGFFDESAVRSTVRYINSHKFQSYVPIKNIYIYIEREVYHIFHKNNTQFNRYKLVWQKVSLYRP